MVLRAHGSLSYSSKNPLLNPGGVLPPVLERRLSVTASITIICGLRNTEATKPEDTDKNEKSWLFHPLSVEQHFLCAQFFALALLPQWMSILVVEGKVACTANLTNCAR